MAVAVRAVSSGNTGTTDTGGNVGVSCAVPTGTTAGDVLYLVVHAATSTGAFATPSGWTEIVAQFSSTGKASSICAAYRKVAATESGTYTVTWGTSGKTGRAAIICAALSGVDTTTPEYEVQHDHGSSGTSTTEVMPSVSPTAADVVLWFASAYTASFGATTWTADASTSEVADTSSACTSKSNASIELATESVAAGATGTRTATGSRSDLNTCGVTIAPRQAKQSLTPDVVGSQAGTVSPTIVAAIPTQNLAPAVIGVAAGIVAPALVPGAITVTPDTVGITAACIAPTLSIPIAAQDLAPTVVGAASGTVAPTLVPGAVSITPTVVGVSAGTVAPTVAAGASALIPDVASSTSGCISPTLSPGATAATPTTVGAASGTVSPTFLPGVVTATPSVVGAASGTVDPSATVGGAILTPDVAGAASGCVAPTLFPGTASATPNVTGATSGTVAPSLVAGSATIIPTTVGATGGTIDPEMSSGAASLAPTVAGAASGTVDPTIVLGSVTLTLAPDPAVVVSEAIVQPSVICPDPAEASSSSAEPSVEINFTVNKRWTFDSDTEELEEVGTSPWIYFSFEGGSGDPDFGCIKFVSTRPRTDETESALKSSTADTWETWGVPSDCIVTNVQIVEWRELTQSALGVLSNSVLMQIVNAAGNSIAGDLIDADCEIETDHAWNVNGPGPKNSVLAGNQVRTTPVRLKISQSIALESFAPKICDQRFDSIVLRITYIPAPTSVLFPIPAVAIAGSIDPEVYKILYVFVDGEIALEAHSSGRIEIDLYLSGSITLGEHESGEVEIESFRGGSMALEPYVSGSIELQEA